MMGLRGEGRMNLARLRPMLRLVTIIISALAAVLVPVAAFPTMAVDPAPSPLNPPLVGFPFSPAALPPGPRDEHKLETLLKTVEYRRYLETTFRRYAALPLLRAWQVENEPLDNASLNDVTNGALPASMVRAEVDLLRSIDLVHQVVVTTFNSSHVALDVAV